MKQPPLSGGSVCVWRELSELGFLHKAESQLFILLLFSIISWRAAFTKCPDLLIKNMDHLHLLHILHTGHEAVKTNNLLIDATEIFRYWTVQARID